VSESSPLSLLREKLIPKARLNLFDIKNRRSSSEEDKNPYDNNHPKQKHFSSHSEESEVIMFRADETSMYEDKNLPVFNCYSPSKCSKFGKNK